MKKLRQVVALLISPFVLSTVANGAEKMDSLPDTTASAIAIVNLDQQIVQGRSESGVEELLLVRSRFLGDFEALDRASRLSEARLATVAAWSPIRSCRPQNGGRARYLTCGSTVRIASCRLSPGICGSCRRILSRARRRSRKGMAARETESGEPRDGPIRCVGRQGGRSHRAVCRGEHLATGSRALGASLSRELESRSREVIGSPHCSRDGRCLRENRS